MKCREQAVTVVGEKFLRGIFNNSGGGNVNRYQINITMKDTKGKNEIPGLVHVNTRAQRLYFIHSEKTDTKVAILGEHSKTR